MGWGQIEQLTMPAVEAISLAEAKAQCRVDSNDKDDFFAWAIRAARGLIDGPDGAGLALVASQWQMRLDVMPPEIWVPMGPVLSIDSVAYLDDAGILQTLPAATYQWRKGHFEARIKPAYGLTWPTVRRQYDAVRVAFTAGFPGTDEDPPDLSRIAAPLRAGMLMLISHWHEHSETVVIGQVPTEVPFGFSSLLNHYRVGRFA